MKRHLLILASCAALLCAVPAARAQAPMAMPTPAATPPAILAPTAEMRAAQVATQISQQINYLFAAIVSARTSGLPARGNQPAVTAAQIDAAFGAANVAKLQAAAAALQPAPSPTP